MRKVLVILPNSIGGAEHQTVRIASYLPVERFDVEFVVIGPGIDKIRGLLPNGRKIHFIRVGHIWQGGLFKLWHLYRREKPYAVFSSFKYLNGRSILAAKLAGIPRTVIRGELSAISNADILARILARLFYRKASSVICQTEELRNEAIARFGVPSERAVALYNAPDTASLDLRSQTASNPYQDCGPRFVNVARITEQKGQKELLRAFALLRERVPDASLTIVGDIHFDEAYFRSLQEIVAQKGLADAVHFAGFQSNPVPWVKFSDCFVLSSKWEGLPNALIEAQYLGVPCVATRCIPSISRVVSDGVNGHLVDVDDEKALAEAMEASLLLKNIPYTYKSASPEEFVKCFEV